MGRVVGAGLLSHAPVIMFPEAFRIEANGGRDFTLATGLKKLQEEVLGRTGYDAVVLMDSHWTTTTEFVVTAHARREGLFTSSEMPTLFRQVPYDIPGDPELARAICREAENEGSWAAAVDDPHLPIQYATLNLWSYLAAPGKPWISVSICQTATTEDFLRFGRAIARAAGKTNKKILVIASGGLSHVFRPLMQLRQHMEGDPKNIVSPEARAADEQRITWLEAGNHHRVVQAMPDYMRFEPESLFGHYLILLGALGGESCEIPGRRFSEYESGIGTGHVHMWFNP
jgi:aromatic ring-opening dioxygenase catalytic subunit (LigB family)